MKLDVAHGDGWIGKRALTIVALLALVGSLLTVPSTPGRAANEPFPIGNMVIYPGLYAPDGTERIAIGTVSGEYRDNGLLRITYRHTRAPEPYLECTTSTGQTRRVPTGLTALDVGLMIGEGSDRQYVEVADYGSNRTIHTLAPASGIMAVASGTISLIDGVGTEPIGEENYHQFEPGDVVWFDLALPDGATVRDIDWTTSSIYRNGSVLYGPYIPGGSFCSIRSTWGGGEAVPFLEVTWDPSLDPAFTVVEGQGAGEFSFVPAVTTGDHTWTFGDGGTSTAVGPTHTYDLPGTFTVTHCVAESVCHEEDVEVAAPQVTAVLSFVDGHVEGEPFRIGEPFWVALSIEASDGVGDMALAFTPDLGAWLDEVDNLTVSEAPEIPDPLVVPPDGFVDLMWELTPTGGGEFEIATTLIATDAAGNESDPVPLALSGEVAAEELDVEIVLPEEPIRLELSTDVEQDPGGLSDELIFDPFHFEVLVRVTVPESIDAVTDLRLLPVADDPDDVFEMEAVTRRGAEWVPRDVQPDPMPVSSMEPPDPASHPGPIAPGETVEFGFIFKADQPGNFRLGVEAAADFDGGAAAGAGTEILEVKAPILGVQMEVSDEHGLIVPSVVEGQSLVVTGSVENLSPTDTIRLVPVHVESEGQGLVRGPVPADDPLPIAGEFGIFNPELAPGDRAEFHLVVDTLLLEGVDSGHLLTREAILLETYMGAIVVDEEGGERDLDGETEVFFEVGNGRHVQDGRTLIRAEVEPQWVERETYTFGEFAGTVGGKALERMRDGAANVFIQMPEMIASLPGAVWAMGSAGSEYSNDQRAAYMAGLEYLWAWTDYHLAIHLDLSSATEAAILTEVTADVKAKYGHLFETNDAIAAAVNDAVTGFYVEIADHHDRTMHAVDYGTYEEVADGITAWIKPAAGFATEELTGQILVSWFGKVLRSERVLDDLEAAAARRAEQGSEALTEATDDVWEAGRDPRTTQAPPSMRTLRDTAPVTPLQAIRGWAIDAISDANLRRLTSKAEGLPIIVAIRSRADETIEWMSTQLGITPKPVTIKPKNVDWRDVQFLGYRDGVGYGVGDRGAVALAEPLPRAEVIARLDAADASDFTRSTVLDRHSQRWKEWYGVPCDPTCVVPDDFSGSTVGKLKAKANVSVVDPETGLVTRRGTLEVPSRGRVPEPADNWDTRGAPTFYDQRRFEMRQIPDPEGLGREYFEVWLEYSDGSMRRVAGDIDIVAVTDTSGKTLRGSSAENVAQQLGHSIDAQHPWSSTLDIAGNPALREEFLNAHRWPDGEPLLIYVNGEARIGWFDPTKTIAADSPLDSVIWLKGGGGDVDNVVRYQRDLRGTVDNPTDVEAPRGHVPAESTVRKALIDADNLDGGSRTATCSVPIGASGAIFRLGDTDQLERRNPDGTFEAVDVDELCEGGEIVVLPDTAILADVVAGARSLPIIDELLDYDWRSLFEIGLCVLIAPGTPREEEACIEDHGSLVLDRPLRYDHDALTRVVLLLEEDDDGGDDDGETPPPPERTWFIDVPEGHLFDDEVNWLSDERITRGCNPPENDRFCPDRSVTRGEMAAFLVRALGLPPGSLGRFDDTASSVFVRDIAALATAGITRGCNPPDNDRFCPGRSVTRGEMAAFLVRALGLDGTTHEPFVDTVDSVFVRDIEKLASTGITRGCNPPANDRFCPDRAVTRAEMAAFLYRALR